MTLENYLCDVCGKKFDFINCPITHRPHGKEITLCVSCGSKAERKKIDIVKLSTTLTLEQIKSMLD